MSYKASWLISIFFALVALGFFVTDCKGGLKGAIFDDAEKEADATVKIENNRVNNEIRLQRFYNQMQHERMQLARLGLIPKKSGPPWWFWVVCGLVLLAVLIIGIAWGASRANQARQVPNFDRDYVLIPKDRVYQIERGQ